VGAAAAALGRPLLRLGGAAIAAKLTLFLGRGPLATCHVDTRLGGNCHLTISSDIQLFFRFVS
jgi:hypothetical protein